MTTAQNIEKRLKGLGDAEDAAQAQRFFKTGPGQYGEGDVFLGIRVPVLRKLAKELSKLPSPACGHRSRRGDRPNSPPAEGCATVSAFGEGWKRGAGPAELSLDDLVELLQSPFHEVRLTALLVMTYQAKKGAPTLPLYRAYLANTDRINNWDLVDVTAEHIVGRHLFERSRRPLYKMAKSSSLWERRIAILSTLYFIRRNDFDDTLALADILLHDEHDLMHKAVGWMLREVGKRNRTLEEEFLLPRYKTMPRTMLRYAIERFDDPLRRKYLKGQV